MFTIRASRPSSLWRALAVIRVAGERFTRGDSVAFQGELLGLLAFCLHSHARG